MNVQHLKPDELEIEFHIRDIDTSRENALAVLQNIVNDEDAGKIAKPVNPQSFQKNDEYARCTNLGGQLREEVKVAGAQLDLKAVQQILSRAIHLMNRSYRLRDSAPNFPPVTSLVAQAEVLLQRIAAKYDELGHNASGELLAGFGSDEREGNEGRNNMTVLAGEGATSQNFDLESIVNAANTLQPPPIHDPVIIATGSVQQPMWTEPTQRFFSSMRADAHAFQPAPTAQRNAHSSAQRNTITSANYNNNTNQHTSILRGQPQSNPVFADDRATGEQLNRNRTGLSHILARWSVKFGGSDRDLPIDEFFFRVQNLAMADNVPVDGLVIGLHCLLTGNAADFYWVHRRKYPNGTWNDLKDGMMAHFAKQVSDLELRKLILGRRQGNSEGFGEFCLSVESLAARMTYGMVRNELVDILRENMQPRLQTQLLMVDFDSVEQLKNACLRYERMWAKQESVARTVRVPNRLAEIEYAVDANESSQAPRDGDFFEVDEIGRTPRTRPEYIICWNCDDIGHSFTDCTSTVRNVFCYGCGAKNVYKPSCGKCSAGNRRSGETNAIRFRPNSNQQPIRQNPNPFSVDRASTPTNRN